MRGTRRDGFHLALVPLNTPHTDRQIAKVAEEQGDRLNQTVLFLDALDEDREAIQDHIKRLGQLIELTRGFRTVLITCRTQFFPRDAEIPTATGVLKVGPVTGSHGKEYCFEKLYLSPFTDEQIHAYLKRRFPLRRLAYRRKARELVKKIPELVARPMLLANIQELVASGKEIKYSFQLYEEMVERWLSREKGLVGDPSALREVCERLAVDILTRRGERGMERVPPQQLEELTQSLKVQVEPWQLRGRSLLNRDAEGNYKFSHRSIMEYLFAKGLAAGKVAPRAEAFTDQIKTFLVEMLDAGAVETGKVDCQKFAELVGRIRVRHPKDGVEYVWIPPGTFLMGAVPDDAEAYDDEWPRHRVRISKGFWLGQTPVTAAAYERFADQTGRGMPTAPDFNHEWKHQDHPIVNVSWADARAYCEWAGGRLPTEAEWESAARGGREGLKYPNCNELTKADARFRAKATCPVAQFHVNGYDLYDMAGNVWEWCLDWYDEGYYKDSPNSDPTGPETGQWRVLRGGSWYGYPQVLRASYRYWFSPDFRVNVIGFWCAREVFL